MREKNYFCVIVSSILLSGCLPSVDPRIDMKPPVYVNQLPSKRSNQHVNSGSLYGRGDNPLFYDRKAMNVNDIVTVVINEK